VNRLETIVTLDGVQYIFVTEKGVASLKLESVTTPSTDIVPQEIIIPDVWLITRRNGVPLFAVRPNAYDKAFRIMTAEELYSEKIQWFEPFADFYREQLWVSPYSSLEGSETFAAYKHHTWESIIDFAIVDRQPLMYHTGLPGDWKKQPGGGDGYLLCYVEGDPYWTDGLGQIPFAVDTFRMYWQQTNDVDIAILKTGATGLEWADGTLGGSDENGSENVYDNFIIIRACLWASKNFCRVVKMKSFGGLRAAGGDVPSVSTIFQPTSNYLLKSSITTETLSKYKVWKS
jgi:hypothetical protein